ncbi:hypothetical protein QBC39DRAFT_434342 [Podospora conica]|nr:hypothetical protein QBC39DRAFT_434342 [Schizothecium conicum]
MAGLLSGIYHCLRLMLGPGVIDGRLNPFHLALARSFYWIQSQIFHIPDRFGMFSPGPPRLQVFEGGLLVFELLFLAHMVSAGMWGMLFAHVNVTWTNSLHVDKVSKIICFMVLFPVVLCWPLQVMLLRQSQRAPGYIWEDWKEHVE